MISIHAMIAIHAIFFMAFLNIYLYYLWMALT